MSVALVSAKVGDQPAPSAAARSAGVLVFLNEPSSHGILIAVRMRRGAEGAHMRSARTMAASRREPRRAERPVRAISFFSLARSAVRALATSSSNLAGSINTGFPLTMCKTALATALWSMMLIASLRSCLQTVRATVARDCARAKGEEQAPASKALRVSEQPCG